MLHRKQYADKLDESMEMYIDLMKRCWGEAPELEPKVEVVLKVSMDFDLGDFPHKGQVFYVSPDKATKLAPDVVTVSAEPDERYIEKANSVATRLKEYAPFCSEGSLFPTIPSVPLAIVSLFIQTEIVNFPSVAGSNSGESAICT